MLTARGIALLLALSAALVLAGAREASDASDSNSGRVHVQVAHGSRPTGGTFALSGTRTVRHGRFRFCYSLARQVSRSHGTIAYALRGCLPGVPGPHAIRGNSGYSCYKDELEVAGGVTARATRVEVELSRGRHARAHVYDVPDRLGFRGNFFVRIVRTGAPDIDDMHAAAIRAFDDHGRTLGTQRFPSGGSDSWGCFAPPPY